MVEFGAAQLESLYNKESLGSQQWRQVTANWENPESGVISALFARI